MASTYFDDDIVATPKRGYGIKFGNKSIATNSTSDKFGWRDITTQITVKGVGAADPTWAQIASGPFFAYKFGLNDECWSAIHIPHDIVPKTNIHFHAHWLADGTNSNTVKWQWSYMYARGFGQEAYSVAGATVTAEQASAGQYYHMVTETSGIAIPTLDEPDGIIYVHLKRITNGGTDNADGIFLLTQDVHYQSTNLGTVNKSPVFYIGE